MAIKLAILNLTAGGISGGYKSYLQNMLPRLAEHPEVEGVLCVSPDGFGIEGWVPPHPKLKHSSCAPYGPLSRRLDEAAGKELREFMPDVVFVPVARRVDCGAPVVCMVQNMAPLVSWEWYRIYEWPRLAVQRRETMLAAGKAEAVIVMSDFVKDVLGAKLGAEAGKLRLVYFGTPALPADSRAPAGAPDGEFVFTAGSLEPYRALEDLLGAAAQLRRAGRPRKFLVAGSARKSVAAYGRDLKEQAVRLGVAEDFIWAGQLQPEEMGWCYDHCAAFVMTSRVETLGVIGLEALSHGCVCVSSESRPLPEVFGRSADYYPPGDCPRLAHVLERVLALGGAERAARREAAKLRAARFNWDSAAEKTLEILISAAAKRA